MKTIFTSLILVVATLFVPITNLCAQEKEDAGNGYIVYNTDKSVPKTFEENVQYEPTDTGAEKHLELMSDLDQDQLFVPLSEAMDKYLILAASDKPSDMEMSVSFKKMINEDILTAEIQEKLKEIHQLQQAKMRIYDLANVHPYDTDGEQLDMDLSGVAVIVTQHNRINDYLKDQKIKNRPAYWRKTVIYPPHEFSSAEKDSIPIEVVPDTAAEQESIIYPQESGQVIRNLAVKMNRQISDLRAGAGQQQVRTM